MSATHLLACAGASLYGSRLGSRCECAVLAQCREHPGGRPAIAAFAEVSRRRVECRSAFRDVEPPVDLVGRDLAQRRDAVEEGHADVLRHARDEGTEFAGGVVVQLVAASAGRRARVCGRRRGAGAPAR